MANYPSDIAFTPSVKAVQERRGSRGAYAKMEETRGWQTTVTPDLAAFIAERESFFLATASIAGQPYIQHRGGPPGFLRVIDERTLAFADFRGNRQYITTGNLVENDQAFIFLMDWIHRRRVKLWGRASTTEDQHFIETIFPTGYEARPEQAIVFTIEAWDTNCPQHIPQLVPADEVRDLIEALKARIVELETENARLLESALGNGGDSRGAMK